MPKPIHLRRRRSDLDVFDAEAVRTAILTEVGNEILLRGEPHPRIILAGDGFTETLSLDAVSRADPSTDVGATFRALAQRPDVEHRFLIFRLEYADDTRKHQAAFVFHEPTDEDAEALGALLPYTTDPRTGLGQPAAAWQITNREGLGPFWTALRPMVEGAPGGRPAAIAVVGAPPPDIGAFIGTLAPELPLPTSASQLADLTGRITRDHILREGMKGPQVVRFSGRDWQAWLLGEELLTDIDDMVRYVCSQEPVADGVALIQLVLFPEAGPPRPGIQIVAEQAGQRFELFGFLEFPEGPAGRRELGRIVGRSVKYPGEGEGWLGVKAEVLWELRPLGAVG